MSKRKFTCVEIPFHIYPRKFFICKGGKKEDVEARYMEISGEELAISEEDISTARALTFCDVENREDGSYGILLWLIEPLSVGVIAHEAYHVACELMKAIGMEHDLDNQEAVAYLIGYIADEIAKMNR